MRIIERQGIIEGKTWKSTDKKRGKNRQEQMTKDNTATDVQREGKNGLKQKWRSRRGTPPR